MTHKLTPDEITVLQMLHDGWEVDDEAWWELNGYMNEQETLDNSRLIDSSMRGFRITKAGRDALKAVSK